MEAHYYKVDIQWENGRVGKMCSPDVNNPAAMNGCVSIATPPEFPQGVAGIWSPEHLFTAAVSSCLMTTFLSIAENSKLDFMSFRCESLGKLDQVDGKLMMTEVKLNPVVAIANEGDKDKALRVLQKAERACLISNSIKSAVSMNPTIEIVTPVAVN